jgi:hypothetical protein
MVITRFEEIEGWKRGRELTRRIYHVAVQSNMKRSVPGRRTGGTTLGTKN